ncbi:MAG: hypothetical protein WCT50_03385 [Patescibacteria group bacterium]
MTSEKSQNFFKDGKEKPIVTKFSGEKNEITESLPVKIENYLNSLNKLKDESRLDTTEALDLIMDSKDDHSSALFYEKKEAINEIKKLDGEKIVLITDSEKALQDKHKEYVDIKKPWLDAEPSKSIDYESLMQEKEILKYRELKVLAAVSYKKIKDHAASLGVEISGLPEEKISYTGDYLNSGVYNTDSDDIKVKSNSAKVIIHEELHFAGAVDNREGRKHMGENRLSKSGFGSVWKAKEGEAKNRDLLRSLNEAVTEKMAGEIFNNNKESIISDVIKADPEIAKLNDELVEKEKALALANLERYLPDKYKTFQENVFIQKFEMEKLSFEELAAEEKQKIESKFNSEMFDVRNQEMLREKNGYNNEIRVLDAILEKLSQARTGQENISLDEARNKEWQDMQRAYLRGETIYLRRIEKIVGPNVLREFSAIDLKKVKREEETAESYQKKINDLIGRINN